MIEIATPAEAKQIIAGLEYVCFDDATNPEIKSASRTLDTGSGQCLEGAFAAAYLMEQLRHPPMILYLQGKKFPNTPFDHVVYAYHDEGFRTIGHSRYANAGTIDAVFSGPEEAVVEYTKRGWGHFIHIYGWGLIDLSTLDGWMDSPDNLARPFMKHASGFEFYRV